MARRDRCVAETQEDMASMVQQVWMALQQAASTHGRTVAGLLQAHSLSLKQSQPRPPNARETRVLKKAVAKFQPLNRHLMVDVSQSETFLRAGLDVAPCFARSSRMCLLPPGKGLDEALLLDTAFGMVACLKNSLWFHWSVWLYFIFVCHCPEAIDQSNPAFSSQPGPSRLPKMDFFSRMRRDHGPEIHAGKYTARPVLRSCHPDVPGLGEAIVVLPVWVCSLLQGGATWLHTVVSFVRLGTAQSASTAAGYLATARRRPGPRSPS